MENDTEELRTRLLQQVLLAYDKFMLSDMDVHVTNPTWYEVCEVMRQIRVYLSRRKKLLWPPRNQ